MAWKENAAATAFLTVLHAGSAGEVRRLGWAEGEHICRYVDAGVVALLGP
jgi:hypothetical protein